MRARSKSFARDVAATFGTTVLSFAAALIAGVVLSRTLGPTGKGQLAQLAVWASFIVDLLLFGLPGATTYTTAQWPEHRRRLATTLARRLAGQAAAALLVFSALVVVSDAADDLPIGGILAYGLWIPAAMSVHWSLGLLQGLGDFGSFNKVRLISETSPAPLLVLMGAAGLLTVASGATVYAMAAAAAAIVGGGFIRRAVSFDTSDDQTGLAEVLREGRSFARREYASTLATKSNRSVDLLVISLLSVSQGDIGVYSVAASSSAAVAVVGISVGMVAFSRSAQRSRDEHVLRSLMWSGGLLTVLVAGSLFLFAPVLIPLVYGSAFDAAVPLVRVLAFGGAAISMSQITAGVLKGCGRPGTVAIAEGLGAAVTVLGILIFGTTNIRNVAYSAVAGFLVTLVIQGVSIRLNRFLYTHDSR
jgi:O-antigen/teichoic acid export membrane protein